MGTLTDMDRDAPKVGNTLWTAPAWFLLGILVGVVGTVLFVTATAQPAPAIDTAALKETLRESAAEALATLQIQNAQLADGALESSGNNPLAPTSVPATPAPVSVSFDLRDANRLGEADASVTIVEFSDFQCPFCERHFQTVESVLFNDYVNTGKATFVYKHWAFLGPESVWAAEASECAADQNRFWDYHNLLFNRQAGENQGAFTKDKLVGFAQELGLDMEKFEPCLMNDETLARVQADTLEGQQAGVSGTPTFFINGQPLVGAQPYAEFQTAIESLLLK